MEGSRAARRQVPRSHRDQDHRDPRGRGSRGKAGVEAEHPRGKWEPRSWKRSERGAAWPRSRCERDAGNRDSLFGKSHEVVGIRNSGIDPAALTSSGQCPRCWPALGTWSNVVREGSRKLLQPPAALGTVPLSLMVLLSNWPSSNREGKQQSNLCRSQLFKVAGGWKSNCTESHSRRWVGFRRPAEGPKMFLAPSGRLGAECRS